MAEVGKRQLGDDAASSACDVRWSSSLKAPRDAAPTAVDRQPRSRPRTGFVSGDADSRDVTVEWVTNRPHDSGDIARSRDIIPSAMITPVWSEVHGAIGGSETHRRIYDH